MREKLRPLATRSRSQKQGQDRESERKEAWTLRATEYKVIAVEADGQERIKWVTGFVRPGKEIPFAKLGDPATAERVTDSEAIWNVAAPNGSYRLIARGQKGKARVISLLSLATPPLE